MFSGCFLLRDPSGGQRGSWSSPPRTTIWSRISEMTTRGFRSNYSWTWVMEGISRVWVMDRLMTDIVAVRKHEIIFSRMTNLYTQHSVITRPITILKRQMDTLRTLYVERDYSKHILSLESRRLGGSFSFQKNMSRIWQVGDRCPCEFSDTDVTIGWLRSPVHWLGYVCLSSQVARHDLLTPVVITLLFIHQSVVPGPIIYISVWLLITLGHDMYQSDKGGGMDSTPGT